MADGLPFQWSWNSGRVSLVKHCDSVFELLCDGIPVMPVGSFEKLTAYLWAEFFIEGFTE